MAPPYAFVTLLTSDEYLPGALALAAALKDLHPSPATAPEVDFDTVCLVTPETVDVSTIKLLRKAFSVVIGVEVITQEDDKGLQLLGRPDLNTVLTKLHVFRLTQYSKIIFLDADVLPIQPLSHLFTVEHDFSAAPDVGWPDIFNSGVLVLSPGQEKFSELNQLLKSKGTWDGGDQGLPNEWRGGNWNRLSFTYNTTPSAAYTYAPAYERFGSQIKALHFIGWNKPWKSMSWRAPFSSSQAPASVSSPQQAYDYNALVDKWYAVYDKHYRTETPEPSRQFEVQRYTSAWDDAVTNAEILGSAPPPAGSALGLEDLRQLAVSGASSFAPPVEVNIRSGEGEYRSMPLEGRIDLMRPRPEHRPTPEQSPASQTVELRSEWPAGGGRNTPGPNEVPPSPRPHPISLPPTPGQSVYIPEHSQDTPRGDSYRQERHNNEWNIQHHPQTHQHEQHYQHPHNPHEHAQRGHHEHQQNSQYQYQHSQHQHQHPHAQHQQPHFPPQHAEHQHQHAHPQNQHVQHQQQHFPLHTEHQHQHQHPQHEHHSQHHPDHHLQHRPQEAEAQLQHRQALPQHKQDPPRPRSPPMLIWNPAVDPPPNNPPTPHAFPSDTYFPNVWDQAPDNKGDQSHHPASMTSPSKSEAFFQPPSTPQIPAELQRQGHYRQVTGEDEKGSTPTPDPAKVKHIFPWEEKPRQMPGRVFPASDAPRPSDYVKPDSPKTGPVPSAAASVTTSPSFPQSPRSQIPSPIYGLPTNLAFANAWDTVPSIQKYASRLVRPPAPPASLAPAFDGLPRRGRRESFRSWEERTEASSRDGDDEDEGDDEDAPVAGIWNDEDDQEKKNKPSRSRRGSSVSASYVIKGKKKEYRVRGVQTVPREMRNQSVQVSVTPPKVSSPKGQHKRTGSRPSSMMPPPILTQEMSVGPDLPLSTAMPSPATQPKPLPKGLGLSSAVSTSPGARSPREFTYPTSPSKRSPQSSTPPNRASPQVSTPPIKPSLQLSPNGRKLSNDSVSVASPLSSIGPISPPDGQPITPTVRKAGRVWDPARGVELFKKGSEEVLARFLRMGSWEDDLAHH